MLESKLAYEIGVEIIAEAFAPWWLVYYGGEGFTPLLYAIRTTHAVDAEDIFLEQDRQQAHNLDLGQIVVVPLKRSTVWQDAETGRFVSKNTGERPEFVKGEAA